MYVILVYDVEQERVAKVCQYLRRHLHWVQNSVFEGELTRAQLKRVKAGLQEHIDESSDSIYLYVARDAKWIDKEVMGEERNTIDTIL